MQFFFLELELGVVLRFLSDLEIRVTRSRLASISVVQGAQIEFGGVIARPTPGLCALNLAIILKRSQYGPLSDSKLAFPAGNDQTHKTNLFTGDLWNSFREMNTKAPCSAIVSLLRRDLNNSE